MSSFTDARPAAAPRPTAAPGLLRWVCTSNPFYVLSAGLFLAGLWTSVEAQADDVQTWALMVGLIGYTFLLAATGCLLVRFAGVWDDVRTVLLLVVLMFLAASVTFDELLVSNPERGRTCFLAGLLSAVAISEGVLRGARLKLPVGFRLPYYLILALFFLYPPAISPLIARPRDEEMLWALFGFSPAAGLVFLTLLPAVRRGPGYVRDNGSPWRWPLYPWCLFGLLALAVPARAFLLCWSLHLLDGSDSQRLVFGPFFVVPFGVVLAVLLLESSLVTGSRTALKAALCAPLALLALAVVGHRPDPVYLGFLDVFTHRVGCDPVFLTLLATVGFYAYAALRGVRPAVELLTLALLALAVTPTDAIDQGGLVPPRPAALLTAACLQLALGLARRSSGRCLLAGCGLALSATAALPGEFLLFREVLIYHMALLVVLLVGAVFSDTVGQCLRVVGGCLVLLACLAVLLGPFEAPAGLSVWLVEAYPLALTAALAGYGLALRHRPSLALAAAGLVLWLTAVGWRGYLLLRQVVLGLDYLTASLALFAVAVLVSLAKSGILSRRLEWWWKKAIVVVPAYPPPPAGAIQERARPNFFSEPEA